MKKILYIMVGIVIICVITGLLVANAGYHRIDSGEGTIYGRLTKRDKDKVVVLVAGSGPTDMNGNSGTYDKRNDSLLMLSKELGREGISVFRYDKRTSGKSKNTFDITQIEFDDFVKDCTQVIRYLKDYGFDKVYIAGHSQGNQLYGINTIKSNQM